MCTTVALVFAPIQRNPKGWSLKPVRFHECHILTLALDKTMRTPQKSQPELESHRTDNKIATVWDPPKNAFLFVSFRWLMIYDMTSFPQLHRKLIFWLVCASKHGNDGWITFAAAGYSSFKRYITTVAKRSLARSAPFTGGNFKDRCASIDTDQYQQPITLLAVRCVQP